MYLRDKIERYRNAHKKYDGEELRKILEEDDILQESIYVRLQNIKTYDDLIKNKKLLRAFRSPTACYFELRSDRNAKLEDREYAYMNKDRLKERNDTMNEVFYIDQQGCVTWALEESSGKVYLFNDDNPYKRTYVAKNLSEFLLRICIENSLWRGGKDPIVTEYKEEFRKALVAD